MVSLTVDTRAMSKMLTEFQQKQLPFATMLALNDVAFTTQAAEKAAIPSIFENPRPFTKNSVQVDKAKKTSLSAAVYIRPEVSNYLAPYEFGGMHWVPGKALLVPKTIRLDQYGQITKTTLARLNAMANDKDSGVFFGEVHGVKGFWMRPAQRRGTQRAGAHGTKGKLNTATNGRKTSLRLLARIEQPGEVKEHLDFIPNAMHQVQAAWPGAMERALAKALASAR